VKREEVFVTSKLNNPYHGRDHVHEAFQHTLKDLQLEYLDLFLVHWPIAFPYVPFDSVPYNPEQVGADGKMLIDHSIGVRETWQAMEELVHTGKVRAIGVCNFPGALIHDLLTYAKVRPAVNQVEMHPYLPQSDLVDYCQREGIVVTAYSPLGTPDFKRPEEPVLLNDPTITAIAKRHNKTAAQVLIRWSVERNVVVIPKSVTPARIIENLAGAHFQLTAEDMAEIKAIKTHYRYLRPFDWYGIALF